MNNLQKTIDSINNILASYYEMQKNLRASFKPYQNTLDEIAASVQSVKMPLQPIVDALNQASLQQYNQMYQSVNAACEALYATALQIDTSIPDNVSSALKNLCNSSIAYRKDFGLSNLSDIVQSKLDTLGTLTGMQPGEDCDDFVILDEAPIRELEIPDTVSIPFGHNRIKMKTPIFLSILGIMLTVIFNIYSLITTHTETNSNTEDNAQLLEYEQMQTQYLKKIFETLDTSNSSLEQPLEDMRSAFQSQGEAHDTYPPSNDNSFEQMNTESEN